MIQRIQSLYLLIVVIIGSIAMFSPMWKLNENPLIIGFENIYILALFAIEIVLALVAIFMFKNRKLQFVLGRLNILINLILLGIFGYYSLTFSGEMKISEKEIWFLIPFVSIVFITMANKAIQKDEELVKSVDRLR